MCICLYCSVECFFTYKKSYLSYDSCVGLPSNLSMRLFSRGHSG